MNECDIQLDCAAIAILLDYNANLMKINSRIFDTKLNYFRKNSKALSRHQSKSLYSQIGHPTPTIKINIGSLKNTLPTLRTGSSQTDFKKDDNSLLSERVNESAEQLVSQFKPHTQEYQSKEDEFTEEKHKGSQFSEREPQQRSQGTIVVQEIVEEVGEGVGKQANESVGERRRESIEEKLGKISLERLQIEQPKIEDRQLIKENVVELYSQPQADQIVKQIHTIDPEIQQTVQRKESVTLQKPLTINTNLWPRFQIKKESNVVKIPFKVAKRRAQQRRRQQRRKRNLAKAKSNQKVIKKNFRKVLKQRKSAGIEHNKRLVRNQIEKVS